MGGPRYADDGRACDDQVIRDPTGLHAGYDGVATARIFLDLTYHHPEKPNYPHHPRILRPMQVGRGEAWIEQMLYTKRPTKMTF